MRLVFGVTNHVDDWFWDSKDRRIDDEMYTISLMVSELIFRWDTDRHSTSRTALEFIHFSFSHRHGDHVF